MEKIADANIKLILFDLGGVLIEIDFQRVLDYWCDVSGLDKVIRDYQFLDDEYFRQHEINAIDFNQYYQHVSKTLGLSLTEQQFKLGWNQVLVDVVHDIEPLLENINPSIPLAIFSNTNWTHEEFWRYEYARLWPYFDSIFTSNRLGTRKPDIQAYAQVLQALNVNAENVIFFDDSEANISGAKHAGIKHSYLIKNSQQIKEILSKAGLMEDSRKN